MLYCFTPPIDFLALYAIVFAMLNYAVELGAVYRRQTLLVTSAVCSAAYIVTLFAKLILKYGINDPRLASAVYQVLVALMWILLAHVIGVTHYNARRLNLWQHRSLLDCASSAC